MSQTAVIDRHTEARAALGEETAEQLQTLRRAYASGDFTAVEQIVAIVAQNENKGEALHALMTGPTR